MISFRVCLVAVMAAVSSVTFAQCGGKCCQDRTPVRAIDRTCLPTRSSVKDVPLYRADVDAQYAQIAYIDSFVADNDCPETIKAQMKDVQKKARAIGADAVIRVKKLKNQVRGFKENMRTPFWSVEQGRWEDYFFRGIAIKYQRWPDEEPDARAERALNIQSVDTTELEAPRVPFTSARPRGSSLGLEAPQF